MNSSQVQTSDSFHHPENDPGSTNVLTNHHRVDSSSLCDVTQQRIHESLSSPTDHSSLSDLMPFSFHTPSNQSSKLMASFGKSYIGIIRKKWRQKARFSRLIAWIWPRFFNSQFRLTIFLEFRELHGILGWCDNTTGKSC